MKTLNGWGFPEGGWDGGYKSHYFVDDHALCDQYLGYSGEKFIGESRSTHQFCEDCLTFIADAAKLVRR